jgi:hypothetical protein
MEWKHVLEEHNRKSRYSSSKELFRIKIV